MISGLNVEIPPEWDEIDVSRCIGTVMIIGAPDRGKSTFARYLYNRMSAEGMRIAYLDGDPGQSTLGPPTTITITTHGINDKVFPPKGKYWRWFIGSITPSGHMLQILVGAGRLVGVVKESSVDTIIYDTSGLVDPRQGGGNLKHAKIDMIRPNVVFAIQSDTELESFLIPLRRKLRDHLIELRPSLAVDKRDVSERRDYRAARFATHFENARRLKIRWTDCGVIPTPCFALNRLISFEGCDGFSIDLGIVVGIDRSFRTAEILTPLASTEQIEIIRLGDVLVDPLNYQDRILWH